MRFKNQLAAMDAELFNSAISGNEISFASNPEQLTVGGNSVVHVEQLTAGGELCSSRGSKIWKCAHHGEGP